MALIHFPKITSGYKNVTETSLKNVLKTREIILNLRLNNSADMSERINLICNSYAILGDNNVKIVDQVQDANG